MEGTFFWRILFYIVRHHGNQYCWYKSDKYREVNQRYRKRRSNEVVEASVGKWYITIKSTKTSIGIIDSKRSEKEERARERIEKKKVWWKVERREIEKKKREIHDKEMLAIIRYLEA